MSRATTNANLCKDLTNLSAQVNKTGATGATVESAVKFVGDNLYAAGFDIRRYFAGDTYFTHRGTDEFAIVATKTSALSLYTDNVERMRVYPDGVVHLSPAAPTLASSTQPAFCATYSGTTAATQGAYVRFETVVFNYGGYYNATNGIFTAPVYGSYLFRFHMLPNNPTTGNTNLQIYKNGFDAFGAGASVQHPANTWNTIYCNVILEMFAGDSVGVYAVNLPASLHTDANYTSFSGYLLL